MKTTPLIGAANSLPNTTEQWLKLAGYGNWPHMRGLQCFTREAAQRMTENFRSLRSKLARKFSGLPVYIGHPDDPDYSGKEGHTDKDPCGYVSDIEDRDDGCYVRIQWNDRGNNLVKANHYRYLSPRWAMQALNSANSFEPVRLLSIGLTNKPNIPDTALANEQNDSNDEISSSDASDLSDEIQELRKQADEFYQLACGADDTIRSLRQQLEDAETRFESEREARIQLLLDKAQSEGRFLPQQREHWHAGISANFDQGLIELSNTPPALPTQARTTALRGQSITGPTRESLLNAVHQRTQTTGEDYLTAWTHTTRQHPHLIHD